MLKCFCLTVLFPLTNIPFIKILLATSKKSNDKQRTRFDFLKGLITTQATYKDEKPISTNLQLALIQCEMAAPVFNFAHNRKVNA